MDAVFLGKSGQFTSRKQAAERKLERVRYLLPEEMDRLLVAAKKFPDERIWFFLYLTANLGTRLTETRLLRVSDLDPVQPLFRVHTIKRTDNHVREILVPENVAAQVRSWITKHELSRDDLFFPSPQKEGFPMTSQACGRWFNLAAVAAGLKIWKHGKTAGRGTHSLRHGNALAILKAASKLPGMSPLSVLMLIQERLGHSTPFSTLHYLHVIGEQDMVKAIGEIGATDPDAPVVPTKS